MKEKMDTKRKKIKINMHRITYQYVKIIPTIVAYSKKYTI